MTPTQRDRARSRHALRAVYHELDGHPRIAAEEWRQAAAFGSGDQRRDYMERRRVCLEMADSATSL